MPNYLVAWPRTLEAETFPPCCLLTLVGMNHDRPVITIVDLALHIIGLLSVVAPLDNLLCILSNSSTGRDGIVVVAVIAEVDSGATGAGQPIAREWLARGRRRHAAEAWHGLEFGGLVEEIVVVRVTARDLVAEHSVLAFLDERSCIARLDDELGPRKRWCHLLDVRADLCNRSTREGHIRAVFGQAAFPREVGRCLRVEGAVMSAGRIGQPLEHSKSVVVILGVVSQVLRHGFNRERILVLWE